MSIKSKILDSMKHELLTQDNRITSDPIWLVQEKKRTWRVTEEVEDGYVWLSQGDLDAEATGEEQEELDRHWDMYGESSAGWERASYMNRWEYVTTFFTEKAANEYMKNQAHNHGELRTYVDSLCRNPEMKFIRNLLIEGTA